MNREWNGSTVMEEYARIASESGLVSTALLAPEKDARKPVGNPDKMPETPTRNEKTEQYDVKPEGAGDDLIQKAHPKDARPADAMGDGGLVETIKQQQEKDIEVATSMPHGMLLGRHAAMVDELVKLANILDGNGRVKAARRVDEALRRISSRPFGKGLVKEALAPLVFIGLIMAGIAATGGAGAATYKWGGDLWSYQEDLATDINDLLETTKSAAEDRPVFASVANELRGLLTPYVSRFSKPLPSSKDKEGLRQYIHEITVFQNQILPKVRALVAGLTAAGDPWWKGGMGVQSRLQGKMKDLERSSSAIMTSIQALANVGQTALSQSPVPSIGAPSAPGKAAPASYTGSQGIKGVQEILNKRGLQIPITGMLDKETTAGLRFLEQQLEMTLAPILKRKGWRVKGMILKSDGTVMNPATLQELLSAADTAVKR